MVYPDNIDRGYFNSQLGTRSDRRHYHLAHLQISLLSEPRSEPECPSTRLPRQAHGLGFLWAGRDIICKNRYSTPRTLSDEGAHRA